MHIAILLFVTAGILAAQPTQRLNVLTGQVDGTDLNKMLPRYLKARAFKMLDDRHEQISRISSRQGLESRRRE
ncbi:MAG: hypothetical protein ABI697_13425, partial [Devosia sp.]